MYRALPVAAAAPLSTLLSGAPVPARAAAVGRHAGFLVVEDTGQVLAVTAPDAVVPPCAVVLPAGEDPRDLLTAQERVAIGGGAIRGTTAALVVRRWWSPPVLPIGAPDPAAVTEAAQLLAALDPPEAEDAARRRALAAAEPAAAALAAGDATASLAALLPVLGLGPGSTPTGDDVAAGVLLGARALGAPVAAVDDTGTALVAAAGSRTTPVSAGLLAEAAAGRAVAPVTRLLRALLGATEVRPAVAALLDLGHTSGADIAAGVLAAATAVPTAAVPLRRSA